MSFYEKLNKIWQKSNSLFCVGLDTDEAKLPHIVKTWKFPLFTFNKAIIDATAETVCAYKPQIAYYAAIGAENQLEMTIQYLKTTYPDIPVILDAKRGDIGSTAEMYAREAFERYGADAVTVNPFMGSDTLQPFLQHKDKGVVILCKTSNPGSKEFQGIRVQGQSIHEIIAAKAQTEWNENRNVVLVVGATYPQEMRTIREMAPDIPFLVPGIGAQGGDLEDVITNGLRSDGYGLIINASRSVIYAGQGDDFAIKAAEAATALRDEINTHIQHRTATKDGAGN